MTTKPIESDSARSDAAMVETDSGLDAHCVACGALTGARSHAVPEVMFGTGETFTYLECVGCRSLQIASPPSDLAPYYPADYYSFEPTRAQRLKDSLQVAGGRVAGHLDRGAEVNTDLSWMEFAGASSRSRIVDIGCGSGRMLRRLEQLGFAELSGADPFVAADFELPGGSPVRRVGVEGLDEQYDLVMFNHSFEHTLDPVEVLKAARNRLTSGGRVLLRVPVVAAAFAEFGVHWIQLDAPRHLHLQTVDGMHRLAARSGLRVVRTRFDSTGFQFWGSLQAQRGIPLLSEQSWTQTRFSTNTPFTRREMVGFSKRARVQNQWSTGDQAGFLLELDQ